MELNLTNHVVLISGSGQGLGKGIAEEFLKENAAVVINDFQAERLSQTEKMFNLKYPACNTLAINADLTKEKEIAFCVSEVIRKFGKIDHLVANLGTGKGTPGWDIADEEWDRLMMINLSAAKILSQYVIREMISKKQGNIIYISSIAGKEVIGAPVAYSVAKAGILAYSKNLARILGPEGIRVNTICPGNIYFENGTWDEKIKDNKAQVDRMLEAKVPLQRFTSPEEVASLVVFLSSDKSAFITGSSITIDGGQTVSI